MIVSALMAVALFAPPETTQSGAAAPAPEAKAVSEAKAGGESAKPVKQCYTATPSGSRLPRRVCVTKAPEKAEAEAQKPE